MKASCCTLVIGFIVLGALPAAAAAPVTLDRAQQLYAAGDCNAAVEAAKEAVAGSSDAAILCGAADMLILCTLTDGDFEGARQVASYLKARIPVAAAQAHLDKWLGSIEAKGAAHHKRIAELEAILKAHPDDEAGADAVFQVGRVELFWGRRTEALAAFQRVIDQFGSTDRALQARLAVAGIQGRRGEQKAAEAIHGEVISRAPDTPFAAAAVGSIMALRLARDDAAGADQRMDQIIKAHPDTESSAMAEYCKGELLLYQGKLYEGEGALGVVARKHADRIVGGAAAVRAAVALMSEARSFAYQRRFDKAIEKYTEAIEVAPKTSYAPQALIERARNYDWAGDEERSQQDCDTVLREHEGSPEVVAAVFYTAQRLQARGKSQDAIALLEHQATAGTLYKQVGSLLVLERVSRRAGLTEKAVMARDRLHTEYPASHEIDKVGQQVEEIAGHSMWFRPERQAAAEAAEIAEDGLLLNLTPHQRSRLMLEIGYRLCRAGDHKAALQWYDRIRREDPMWDDTVTVLARSGECRAHLKDFPAAVSLLEVAVSIQPLPREKGRMLLRAAEFCLEGGLCSRGGELLRRLQSDVPVDEFPEIGPPTLALLEKLSACNGGTSSPASRNSPGQ